MSQEHEKALETALQSDNTPDEGSPALAAVRGGFGGWTRWSEAEHTETDIRECTDQHCMNVEVNCGFQGLDPDSPLSQSAGVGDDLRAAWKSKLAGEGKTTSGPRSLRDIVFGSVE
ncbi:MAG: hypothetical protein ACRDRY_03260 [Pseudonocardiaceae bacterium]